MSDAEDCVISMILGLTFEVVVNVNYGSCVNVR